MRRISTLFVTWFAVSSLVVSCGGRRDRDRSDDKGSSANKAEAVSNTSQGAKEGTKEIVVHMEADPPHFNYLIKADAWTSRIVNTNVTESLIRENPFTFEMEPLLAEKWEVSEDGMNYTFHLRKGVKWHDGQPFTSADVVFTFDKIFDPTANTVGIRGDFEPFLDDKNRYEAPDEYTFVLHLKKKSAFLLASISGLPILPKHVFETGDFNNHPKNSSPVGTGPYIFEKWERGKEVVLIKNPDYWGTPGTMDKIIWRQVTKPEVAFASARAGEIDMMGRLRPEQLDQLEQPAITEKFNHGNYYPSQYSFFMFNMERPVFKDKAVRKAISMLIDRETIKRELEKDRARLIESPYPYESKSYNRNLEPIKYDPEKAIQLLEEAGWKMGSDGYREKNGLPLAFKFYLTAGSTTLEKEMTFVQNDFKKAGIRMDLEKMEWSIFSERLDRHDFDLVAFIFIHNNSQSDQFGVYHSSMAAAGGNNYGSYSNPEVDALLEQIREELDPEKRIELEWRLQEILHDDLPLFYTFGSRVDYIIDKKYTNTDPSPIYWFQVKQFAMAPAQ